MQGPIVRITPREVHVNDLDFLLTIYPLSPLEKRDKDPVQLRGLDVGLSTASTVCHNLHHRRREAIAPFFAEKNVLGLESMIRQKVEQGREVLDRTARDGREVEDQERPKGRTGGGVIDLYDLYYAYARE